MNDCEIFPDLMLERVWRVACSCPQGQGGEFDPTRYWTKEQTQARIDSAKADVEQDIEQLARDVEAVEADVADTFSKDEVDAKLALKSNIADVYDKDAVDSLLATKASTATTDALSAALDTKQATLESGVNIKTINNQSILGSGNLEITASTVDAYTKAETNALLADKQDASGMSNYATTATVATKADITALTQVNGVLTAHTADTVVHVTQANKNAWNSKLDPSALTGYATEQWVEGKGYLTGYTETDPVFTGSPAYSITDNDKTTWGSVTGKADTSAVTAVNNALTAHTADTVAHTTATEKATWNAKQDAISDLATIRSNASNAISQLNGYTITSMTKTQFDALTVKDTSTIYFIKD